MNQIIHLRNKSQFCFTIFLFLFVAFSNGQNIVDMNLLSVNESGSSEPGNFTAAQSGFYFKVDPLFSRQDIYFTDGTDIGTLLVYDNPTNYEINLVGTLGDNLFFTRDNGSRDEILFYFDKNLGSITQLTILSSGSSSSSSGNFVLDFEVFNSIAYFSAYTPQTGYELFQSDGTISGTSLAVDINTSFTGSSSFPSDFTLLNGNLLFSALVSREPNGDYLSALWRITTNGVIEQITNPSRIDIKDAQIINNEIYYLGSNDMSESVIYKTDGTLFNESIVFNYTNNSNQYIYKLMGSLNDDIVFISRKSNNNVELEKLNTTSLTMVTLDNLQTGTLAPYLDDYDLQTIQLPDKIIFTYRVNFPQYDVNLYSTDGTTTGSYFLTNTTSIQPLMRARLLHKTANDHVLFIAQSDSNGNAAIYHLNPDNDQINITDKIFGSGNSGAENEFLLHNNITYLLADDGLSGFELFSYDEIQDVATKIVDIENKGDFPNFNSSSTEYPVNSIIPFKQGFLTFGSNGANSDFPNLINNIFFYDPINQNLNPLHIGRLSFPTNFVEQIPVNKNDNYVIFAANNGTDGIEPWVTDGTATGTFQLGNFNLNGSSINESTVFWKAGDFFFFNASDGSNNKIYYTNGNSQTEIFNPLNETSIFRLNSVVLSNNKYYFNYRTLTENKVVITDINFNLIDSFNLSTFVSYFHVYNNIIIIVEPDASTNYWNNDIYFQTNSSNRQFVGTFYAPRLIAASFPLVRNTLEFNNQFHFIIGTGDIITTDGTIAGTFLTTTSSGQSINHLFSINNRMFATNERLPNTTGKSTNIVEINIGGSDIDPFASYPLSQFSSLTTSYIHTDTYIIRQTPFGENHDLKIYDVTIDSFYDGDFNIINDNHFPFDTDLRASFSLDLFLNSNRALSLGRSVEHGVELYTGLIDFSTLSINNNEISSNKNHIPIIYPNPVKDVIYLDTNNIEVKSIELFDLTGKKIDIRTNINLSENKINLINLKKGIYIMRLLLSTGTEHSIKIIKE